MHCQHGRGVGGGCDVRYDENVAGELVAQIDEAEYCQEASPVSSSLYGGIWCMLVELGGSRQGEQLTALTVCRREFVDAGE